MQEGAEQCRNGREIWPTSKVCSLSVEEQKVKAASFLVVFLPCPACLRLHNTGVAERPTHSSPLATK